VKVNDRPPSSPTPGRGKSAEEINTRSAGRGPEIQPDSRPDRARGTRPLDPGDLAFLPDRGQRSAIRLPTPSGSKTDRSEAASLSKGRDKTKVAGKLTGNVREEKKSAEARLMAEFKGDREIRASLERLNLSKRDSAGGRLGDTLVKMLESNPKMPGYKDGRDLAAEVLTQLYRPVRITQGQGTSTCTTASLQTILARSQPAEYARIALDLATRNEASLQGGARITASKDDFKNGEGRSALSDAFQMGLYRLGTSRDGRPEEARADFGMFAARSGRSSFAGLGAFTRKSSFAGDNDRGLDVTQYRFVSQQALGETRVNVRADRDTLARMQDANERTQTVFLRPDGKGQPGHAVTLANWEDGVAVLADPAQGITRMSLDELASRAMYITSSAEATSTSEQRLNDVLPSELGRLTTLP
jgi:hypothetical protein